MGLFYIYQARDLLPGSKEVEMPFLHQVSVFFLLSTIMSTLWFVAWARRMIVSSVAAIILYLIMILAAYFRLGINLDSITWRKRLVLTAGWSMYAGWVTVAALVNFTTGLVYFGFENLPFTELQWTITAIVGAVVINLVFLFIRRDNIFSGVGAWALIGLCITYLDVTRQSNFIILVTSAIGAAVIILFMLLRYSLNISHR